MTTLILEKVRYLPRELAPGILYVSEEYAVAGHLCPCGCRSKVVTPLGPAEWAFTERGGRPSLRPSVGNWQLACRSHYFVVDGQVCSATDLPDSVVLAGRRAEERRRAAYYASVDAGRGIWARFKRWLSRLVSND